MTDCCDDTVWIQARLDAAKARVLLYETALSAIASGAQSYSLDTGQTRQVVTKANVTEVRRALEADLNLIRTLGNLLTGCGTTHVVPSY
jgi:hypothetical protein